AERVVPVQHPVDVAELVDDNPLARFLGCGQLRRAQLPPERRHLDGLETEPDVRQTEAAADYPAVPEEAFDLIRVGVGADIEIFWPAPEQQVPYAAPDQVCGVVALMEPVEDLQRVGIDLLARDRVFGARHDHRNRHRSAIVTKRYGR